VTTRLALAFAALLSLAAVACSGDDDSAEETLGAVSPVGTKDPEATTAAPAPGDGPPAPAEPELDEQLTEVARGELTADIEPGGAYQMDPLVLAQETGQAPDCGNLQFDFSWQVVDPYPPDGVALSWQFTRPEGTVEVANGPAGNQAVGCGTLAPTNEGSAPISVAIKYAIGAFPQ
jgi:hypothetical protein